MSLETTISPASSFNYGNSRVYNSHLFCEKKKKPDETREEYRVHVPRWKFNEDDVYNSTKRSAKFLPYSTLNPPPHPSTLASHSQRGCSLRAPGGTRVVTSRGIVVCRWRATTAGRVSKRRYNTRIRSYRGKWGIPGNGAQQPAYRPAPTFKSRSRGNFTARLPLAAALVPRELAASSIWISTIAGIRA